MLRDTATQLGPSAGLVSEVVGGSVPALPSPTAAAHVLDAIDMALQHETSFELAARAAPGCAHARKHMTL